MGKDKEKKQELTKEWLFQENIRLKTLSDELDAQRRILQLERERLNGEQRVFEQKRKILEMNFRKLADERDDFTARVRKFMKSDREEKSREDVVFFCGITDASSLKKRYKALLKVYHPDNRSGDEGTLKRITEEYEKLKKKYRK